MVSVSNYIMDTSSMLSQKPDEQYRRTVYKSLWTKIDEMVREKKIVTCSEIAAEVQDENIRSWLVQCEMLILPIDDEIQDNVREIVTNVNINLVDFKANKSSGDVFLLATAKKYGLTVISEESTESPKKIPFTCQKMGIKCLNLLGFMEDNGIAL